MKAMIKVEFIFGIIVFIIIIIYSMSQINSMFIISSSDSKIDVNKLRANTILNLISEDDSIGLIVEPYRFYNPTDLKNNGCPNLEKYNLGQYRLTLYQSGQDEPIIKCGSNNTLPASIFEVKYISFDDNTYGRMVLEMW
ncbi:MAG: hypothetical protein J7K26_02920 [Candidatus Aenigmarchaeota archaeon]|nr:hypothetical protein [Candidatus Aenigmarchaeota archaeon]